MGSAAARAAFMIVNRHATIVPSWDGARAPQGSGLATTNLALHNVESRPERGRGAGSGLATSQSFGLSSGSLLPASQPEMSNLAIQQRAPVGPSGMLPPQLERDYAL